MKTIFAANDIVPIGEFKTSMSKWLKSVQKSGHPLIITRNGKPSGVLLSPKEYDELIYRRSLVDSVERGLSDVESGRTFSTDEVIAALASRRADDKK